MKSSKSAFTNLVVLSIVGLFLCGMLINNLLTASNKAVSRFNKKLINKNYEIKKN